MALEQGDNIEARSFVVPSGLAEHAGLSRSAQDFFQPIDRAIANRQDLPWALDFGTGADLYQSAAYTGERLSVSALMADDVEQKLDAPKIKPPSEVASLEGQFTDTSKQETWTDATEANRTTQKDSATMEALSDARIAEIKAAGGFQKFELFDSKAPNPPTDQVLLDSNITPNVPNLEQMQPYQNVQSDTDVPKPDAIVAKNLRDHALGTDIVRVAMPSGAADRAVFPYRGSEDLRLAECTKQNPEAWNNALNAYPKLAQYLSTSEGVRLMQALVRNELHWYDPKDALGDRMARAGHPDYSETLGYAQITPKGIHEFETGVINGQQVRLPDMQLSKFLAGKGYSGTGHEAKALEDPSCVPMIIAAKLNTLIYAYEKSGTPINTRTLAYGYNADVYYNPSNPGSYHVAAYPLAENVERRLGNVKAFPVVSEEALKASTHLRNVEDQMSKIQ